MAVAKPRRRLSGGAVRLLLGRAPSVADSAVCVVVKKTVFDLEPSKVEDENISSAGAVWNENDRRSGGNVEAYSGIVKDFFRNLKILKQIQY